MLAGKFPESSRFFQRQTSLGRGAELETHAVVCGLWTKEKFPRRYRQSSRIAYVLSNFQLPETHTCTMDGSEKEKRKRNEKRTLCSRID